VAADGTPRVDTETAFLPFHFGGLNEANDSKAFSPREKINVCAKQDRSVGFYEHVCR
jgi:hypothetical protein